MISPPSLFRYATHDPDKAAGHLFEAYGPGVRWEPNSCGNQLRMQIEGGKLDTVTLMRCDLAGYSLTRTMSDVLQVTIPIRGTFRQSSSRGEMEFATSAMCGAISRPHERLTHAVPAGTGVVAIIPIDKVCAAGEALSGGMRASRLLDEMAGRLDLREPVSAALARNMQAILCELHALNEAGISTSTLSGLEAVLLKLAAGAIFPAISQNLRSAAPSAEDTTTHRIRDYLAEHACEPQSITVVAADFGISVRTLQDAFHRQFGYSPRDFILNCRMSRARSVLLEGQLGDTVTRIALDSGFTDVSYFATKYRELYGELPSETLRHAQLE